VTRSLLLSLQHAFAVQLLREHVCGGGRGEWLLRYTASPQLPQASPTAASQQQQQQQLQLSPNGRSTVVSTARALPPRSPLRNGTANSSTATATTAATAGISSNSSRSSANVVNGAIIESAVGVVVVADAAAALQQQQQCSDDSQQLCGIEAAVRRLLSDDELMATLQQVRKHYSHPAFCTLKFSL
jgi:cobalamin biosynthesis Mg chelatase CobN